MKWKVVPKETLALEKARDEALRVLDNLDPIEDPVDYPKTLAHVETLSKLLTTEKSEPLNKNTVLTAFVNLAGIALIVEFERVGVVGSKALDFVKKSFR